MIVEYTLLSLEHSFKQWRFLLSPGLLVDLVGSSWSSSMTCPLQRTYPALSLTQTSWPSPCLRTAAVSTAAMPLHRHRNSTTTRTCPPSSVTHLRRLMKVCEITLPHTKKPNIDFRHLIQNAVVPLNMIQSVFVDCGRFFIRSVFNTLTHRSSLLFRWGTGFPRGPEWQAIHQRAIQVRCGQDVWHTFYWVWVHEGLSGAEEVLR